VLQLSELGVLSIGCAEHVVETSRRLALDETEEALIVAASAVSRPANAKANEKAESISVSID